MADDFITEVNEEMRLQRLRAAARRWGAVVAGVVIAGAIGAGVWEWKQHALTVARQEASGRFFTALDTLTDPQHDKTVTQAAEKTFADLAAHGPSGIRSYAAVRLAELNVQDGDVSAAVALWNGVADDGSAEPALRDFSRYMALNVQTDGADLKGLRSGYEKMAQSRGGWSVLAQEGLVALDLRAGASADQQKEGRRLLMQIVQNPSSPEGARARAQALLETFGDAG